MRERSFIAKAIAPIGINPLLGYDNPQWIMAAASLAASIGSSIFGGAAARKARKRQEKAMRRQRNEEKAWYDKQYNTDYLDTKAGQNLMRRAQDVQDSYIRKADGASAVGGGTAASSAMAKEAANKTMGDAIANIGAQDTARKQQVADKHMSNLNQFSQQDQNFAAQSAQQNVEAAQNASNAMMSAAQALGSGLSKAPTNGSSSVLKPDAAEVAKIKNANVTPDYSSYLNSATGV